MRKIMSLMLVGMMIAGGFMGFITLTSDSAEGAGLDNGAWPMFHGNVGHTGLSFYDTYHDHVMPLSVLPPRIINPMNSSTTPDYPYETQVAWTSYRNATLADFQTADYEKYTTGATTVFSGYSPMVHVVYVGTDRGNVYSLNSIDGFPSWIKTVDNSNITVIHGENEAGVGLDPYLYVGTENGNIVKLHDSSKINTTTNHTEGYGVIEWNYSTGARITAEPLVNQDTHTVYVANWNGEVLAMDTNLGTVKWQQNVGAPVKGDMVLSADRNFLYIGTASDTAGKIYSISTSTGSIGSTYNEMAPLNTGLAYDDKPNTIYYTIDDTLYSRSVSSSGLADANSLKLSGMLTAPTVDIHTGSLYVASSDSTIFSVRPDMTIRWKNKTNLGPITIAPVYSDELEILYTGTSHNNLLAINANDGIVRMLAKISAPISGKPLLVHAVPQQAAMNIGYQKGLFVTTRCSIELMNAAGKIRETSATTLPSPSSSAMSILLIMVTVIIAAVFIAFMLYRKSGKGPQAYRGYGQNQPPYWQYPPYQPYSPQQGPPPQQYPYQQYPPQQPPTPPPPED